MISRRSIEARPRRVFRLHLVEGSLRGRHVVGRLEELDYGRGALVRVVENLHALGRDVNVARPSSTSVPSSWVSRILPDYTTNR